MLSDESSSDSETGRFKGRSEKQDQTGKSTNHRENTRPTGRDRHSDNTRFRREVDRKWEEKDRSDRVHRERPRYSRNSPIRRRRSNDRSPIRKRSRERNRKLSSERFRTKDGRSNSRDRQYRSRPHKPDEHKKVNEEIQHNVTPKDEKTTQSTNVKRADKFDRGSHDKQSSSPEIRMKRSEIYKPAPKEKRKDSVNAIVVVEDKDNDSNASEEVQPGSYYSMVPCVVKEKQEESSEIDSSDDEKLRAKLLKLEKELHQAKKKKHKKKHRKKDKSIKIEKDIGTPNSVEVSSTTDIQNKVNIDASGTLVDTTEVTSTQKSSQVESNEEGEIISDDDSQTCLSIDPNDLRHKLKRSVHKSDSIESNDLRAKMRSKSDVCGPALPPHLENCPGNRTTDTEGPALPPHLRKMDRKIGPSIPDQLREKLAQGDCEIIKCESSEDEGIGPVPASAEGSWSAAHRQLEERALHMKMKALEGHSLHDSKVKSREQWMLELPEGKAKYLGLEARSFRAKEGPDMSDRSSWTDTPEQKARKQVGLEREEDLDTVLQREARARQLAQRDEDQEKAAMKHKKKHKREESLLEMHERKLKKKKKKSEKEEGKAERRPFSRDVDLQVNRFDEAQKRSVIKKAQQLDARFSRGEAKYL